MSDLSKSDKKLVACNIKIAMRFPNKAYDVLKQSKTVEFLSYYGDYVSKSSSVPAFFKAAASLLSFETIFGSLSDYILKYIKK
jgi:hypothetical protein